MQFVKESIIRATPQRLFAFHELPDAFELLLPPGENLKILQRADISRIGSRAIVEQMVFGIIPIRWVAEHTKYEPPRLFEDVQISGPFASWRHRHRVLRHADGSILRDEIEYEPPFWILGRFAAPLLMVPKLQRVFDYRHEVTRKWAEKS